MGVELGRRGQFDHGNVIADGVWIVVGVRDGLYWRENGYNESRYFFMIILLVNLNQKIFFDQNTSLL